MEKIRILIADDHPMFREGLCQLLNNVVDLQCAATARDGAEAVKLAQELHPDVALVDIAMPNMDGINAAREIKCTCPNTAIVMISAFKYDQYIVASIRAGVDGYLLKDMERLELINAIRTVHSGKSVFDLKATTTVMRRLVAEKGEVHAGVGDLKSRELEVLKLVARGIHNKDIAQQLNISNNTVRSHLVNIFKKLGVESRTEATVYALKEGWITIDELSLSN